MSRKITGTLWSAACACAASGAAGATAGVQDDSVVPHEGKKLKFPQWEEWEEEIDVFEVS